MAVVEAYGASLQVARAPPRHASSPRRLLPALCVVTVENQLMQRWVRGDSMRSDNGWIVETEMDISKVYDTVPGLPKDRIRRKQSIMVMDVDVGQKWKLFIEMLGYGTFSFDSNTRKLHRLATKGGKEYGKPICAYFPAWPPAFLAQA